MPNWTDAANDWWKFTKTLEEVQSALHCSYRNAWFRGHESCTHRLIPSALRHATPPGLGSLAELNGDCGPLPEDLRTQTLLEIDGIENKGGELQLVSDLILESTEAVLENDIRKMLRELRATLSGLLRSACSVELETSNFQMQLRPKNGKGHQVDHSYREFVASRLRDLKAKQSSFRSQIAKLRERICVLRGIYYGERHSLLAFRQRSATTVPSSSSWILLAAMQHHGVPTRLLDWTASAGVAVYFAIKSFRKTMVEREGSIANWLERNSNELALEPFENHEKPMVWVMNPYFLARRSIGFNRIDDPSIRTDLDYLFRFHEEPSWPYNGPMPAVIPWQSERALAQRGTFTIHGRDTRPIEDQVEVFDEARTQRNALLGRVELSHIGALYAIRHIVQFFGLDQFTMFRGEDDLAQSVAEQGRRRRSPRKDADGQGDGS